MVSQTFMPSQLFIPSYCSNHVAKHPLALGCLTAVLMDYKSASLITFCEMCSKMFFLSTKPGLVDSCEVVDKKNPSLAKDMQVSNLK